MARSDTDLNPLWRVWDSSFRVVHQQGVSSLNEFKVPGTEYSLRGFSIAALRTNFVVRELNIMLDAGISGNMAPDHIFITHCHSDHCANLPYHLYSSKENSRIQIYAPSESADRINDYIKSANLMSCETSIEHAQNSYNMVPVDPGTFELVIKNKKFNIEVLKCYHTVPCVGYGFIEKRRKLKDEYAKLSSREVSELKKKGTDINKEVQYPTFCFLGDTDRRILENSALEKYSTVMVECTFILESELDQAAKTQHMHWDHLKGYIIAHPNINFVLYHFSLRYKKSVLIEFFNNINLPNVVAWVSN
jgi:ribonuclease Z